MAKIRGAVFLLVLLAGIWAFAVPATAGGSVWDFDRPYYEPGDLVVASAAVSWAHYDTLGTPDDGPYGAWVIPVDAHDPWPGVDPIADQIERARYVADVRIEVGTGEINGMRVGPNIARVEFRVPKVAPGLYSLLHCNYPCTTTLGDVTWGLFWVGPPDPDGVQTSGYSAPRFTQEPPVTTTVPPTTTTIPATTTTAPPARLTRSVDADLSDSNGMTAPVVAAGAVALAVGSAAFVWRRRPGRGNRADPVR